MSNLKHKIRHAFAEFAEISTMHGFKDIKDSSNIAIKAMWILAICGSVALFGYQTKFLLDTLLEEKTAISINTDVLDEDQFQTVVYCSGDWINLG